MNAVEVAQIGLALCIAYAAGCVVYNILFHPLRKFPGPLFHRMSVIPLSWHQINGTHPFHIHELHKRYGPVVRIKPNELVFCSPQAWQDIYGHRKAGVPELPKYKGFYRTFEHIPISIITAERQEHSALRRRLAHGFSERSMREQEPIIGHYVDLLISQLRTAVKGKGRQNLREWYNWTTFDVIGDLSFGAKGGFGCLENVTSHAWVKLFSTSFWQSCIIRALYHLGLKKPMTWLSKSGILADSKQRSLVYDKVGERMASGERPDFLEGLIKHKDELNLNQRRLAANASLLIIAGSETTATLLCGATYFLATHPNILKKLQQEVRSVFKSDQEITLTSVSGLSYMLACLNETFRCYPPVASGLPRQVPAGGATIDGKFIPQGAVVSVIQWAINHDERFWTEPETFAPERWMGDPKYQGDRFDAMQPFSVGPRNCIGRNLAYAEMRLILAKMIYNFDMDMVDESREWLGSQKVYDLWDKGPLDINLKPAVL
ncbi:putative cytochrome P450 monooxygenase [Xylaria intraflava]|nr:putative cytochrome P450 monooxygenase [Xylaria intraflava]